MRRNAPHNHYLLRFSNSYRESNVQTFDRRGSFLDAHQLQIEGSEDED